MGVTQLWQAPELFNQGSPAGGGAYLVGSLAEIAIRAGDDRRRLYCYRKTFRP